MKNLLGPDRQYSLYSQTLCIRSDSSPLLDSVDGWCIAILCTHLRCCKMSHKLYVYKFCYKRITMCRMNVSNEALCHVCTCVYVFFTPKFWLEIVIDNPILFTRYIVYLFDLLSQTSMRRQQPERNRPSSCIMVKVHLLGPFFVIRVNIDVQRIS